MSASSMGPIGMPNCMATSSIVASGTPVPAASIASVMYGISTRFTRKPGALRQGSGSLSMARVKASAAARACGSVAADSITSTSGICATGLKKCKPTSRPGTGEPLGEGLEHEARGVGGEECTGLQPRFEACVQFALRLGVFEDGLDHHVGAVDAAACHVRLQARHLLGGLAGNAAALLEEGARAVERGLHELVAAVLQRHGVAAQRTPRGDVAAHDAGADDVHVAARRGSSLPPSPFSRSCRKNTRTRLRDVALQTSRATDWASAS